jgi:hypothetical protein
LTQRQGQARRADSIRPLADGNESSGAQDAVARGEVGFLLENVVVAIIV